MEITLSCLNRFMKFGTRNYMLRYLPSVDRHQFYRVGREMTKKNTYLDSLHLHKTLIVDLWACDLKIECLTLLFYLHCQHLPSKCVFCLPPPHQYLSQYHCKQNTQSNSNLLTGLYISLSCFSYGSPILIELTVRNVVSCGGRKPGQPRQEHSEQECSEHCPQSQPTLVVGPTAVSPKRKPHRPQTVDLAY